MNKDQILVHFEKTYDDNDVSQKNIITQTIELWRKQGYYEYAKELENIITRKQSNRSSQILNFKQSSAATLIHCPTGQFMMGASTTDCDAMNREKPQRSVTLTRSFMVLEAPVTQAQFEEVMGYNPSHFGGNPEHPVENVSWHEAAAFCNALSRKHNLPEVYQQQGSGKDVQCTFVGTDYQGSQGFRLPTEAEWEYMARAGCEVSRYGQIDDIAWHDGNADNTTHPVKQKQPNAWGLYDTLGNVWEWCFDSYNRDAYTSHQTQDPIVDDVKRGASRVVRGGGWYVDSRDVRASYRYGVDPSGRLRFLGFRPVRLI